MLPIRGLYEVAIPVRHLPRAETFYRDVLGLEVGLREDRRKWLFLRAGGGAGMIVLQEHAGECPTLHFAFAVNEGDLERAATVLRERGVATMGPVVHEWIPGKSLYFCDPDGHDLELFASTATEEERTMPVKAVPEGYHSITPYLTVQGVAQLIEFAKAAFDAKEKERIMGPDGRIAHAEVKIGDSVVMMGEARDDWKPMPGAIYLYTTDADATYQRALKAGATSLAEPVNQFYGDRQGGVRDPVGNVWWIATRIEDVSTGEIQKRAKALMSK